MKKIVVALFIIIPATVLSQIKPSIPKAEKALREGKIEEAKSIIDATVSNQEFMVDKKGQPSKNAAKAWYLKGMVYAAMDTSKVDYKNLEADPWKVAKEAFDKSKEIDANKSATFFNDPKNGFPILFTQTDAAYANVYFNKAIAAYNEKSDDPEKKAASQKAAYRYAVSTLYFAPTDTTVLLYTGGVFAPNAKDYDGGIDYLNQYVKAGGKSPEAYTMMANIYRENKKDNASSLKVLLEGKAKFPNYKDIASMELSIYLNEKKYDEAKKMVEGMVSADPNKENYFLLGQLNRELGDAEKAKEAFRKVLEIDPKYFDAAAELANLYWADAKKLKDEMGKLGNSKDDMTKLKAIDAKYVEKLKIYLPYLEACEKLSPDDVTVLYSLLNVYGDLDDQPKIARVKKRLKALGEEVN